MNMDFAGAAAIGSTTAPVSRSWTGQDVALYALAVGATPDEAHLVVDGATLAVLPAYAAVLCGNRRLAGLAGPLRSHQLVHAGQSLVLHRPLDPAGALDVTTSITDVRDQGAGRHALVVARGIARDAAGDVVVESTATSLVLGAGGFGGAPPGRLDGTEDTAPTDVSELATSRVQPLLFRLLGDRNPIHVDDRRARAAGFPGAIMHGLCTYGMVGLAAVRLLCGGDPRRLSGLAARFRRPVHPGERLRIEWWRHDDGAAFRVLAGGRVVMDEGRAVIDQYRPTR